MANAVVGDFGDKIPLPSGQNLTYATELYVYITKPDGTLVTKTTDDGVNDGSAPTLGVIYYVIEAGLLDQAGTYRFSCGYADPDGVFSAGGYDTYTVIHRNQSQ